MIAVISYIITLFLIFILIKLTIKWYFKSKINRYSQKSNYIFKYAIALVFSAFCIINSSITHHLINWVIDFLNSKYDYNLSHVAPNMDFYSIILYVLFCLVILFILNIVFKSRKQEAFQQYVTKQTNQDNMKKELSFPDDSFKESPIFHERIKKYFELKYKKQELKLNTSTKDNIIYGHYSEGFRHYFKIIKYLDNEEFLKISIEKQSSIIAEIKDLRKRLKSKDDNNNYLYDYYYVIKNGDFEPVKIDNFFTFTEDTLLNQLIDFSIYLKSLISKFKHEKIFSAIAKESKKKTLSDTFIMPSFSIEENTSPSSTLEQYITDWLKYSPTPKHLVLLGDYGMGKTSFLKYYSKKLAEEILYNNDIIRYPVFISLNNTSPRHGGIKKSISAFVAENLGVDYELFEILIHKGKLLFLLDAFDEMGFVGTHDDRFKQINEIWKLAYKNNKILLAGRSSYFPSDFELRQTLNIISKENEVIQTQPYCSSIKLGELDENKIKEYISKYYNPGRTEQFFDWIERAPSILELCKRPSLMHIIREMLPNLHRNNSNEIHNPGGAIEKYINYWINRQESKQIQSAFSDSLKKRDFIKSFFRHIAVNIFLSKQLKVSAEFVKDQLELFVKKYEIKNLSKKYQKEGFENEILTGYFLELENDSFRFVHKSFFEFFVATEIISLIKEKKFKSKILFEDWSNPIVNFIYDVIPYDLIKNKKIPALMLLMNGQLVNKIKNRIARFFLTNDDIFIGILILITFFISIVMYFLYIPLSTTYLIILLIPFIILLVFTLALITFSISKIISNNKYVKFIIKAFKVAFIKEQFDVNENLNIVLPLLKRTSAPHIPLENIEFNSESFNDCKFYRLKNIKFNNCRFNISLLSKCHLQNVDFMNSKMTKIIFSKCRLTNVNLNELTLTYIESKSSIQKKINHKNKNTPLIFFQDCKFDATTINYLNIYLNNNNFKLGKEIDGSENFYHIFRRHTTLNNSITEAGNLMNKS